MKLHTKAYLVPSIRVRNSQVLCACAPHACVREREREITIDIIINIDIPHILKA